MPGLLGAVETIALIPTICVTALLAAQLCFMLFLRSRPFRTGYAPSVSVLMPCHNEGSHIAKAVDAVMESGYKGRLELIVVDDGSTDCTQDALRPYAKKGLIRVLRTNHVGKSNALNAGLKKAKNELVLTIDGDTFIEKGAIGELVAPFREKDVFVTTGTLKAANTSRFLSWFQRVEYFYYSFYKELCNRIGGMIWALGPLSAFRRSRLVKAGGFDSRLYAEDIDIALKMVKAGGRVVYTPKAVSSTFVPDRFMPFWRQRLRWARADIQIAKKFRDMYFSRKRGGAGLFTLPVMSYWYFHGAAVLILVALQVVLGFNQYFLSNGVVFSSDVAMFFVNWFTLAGIASLIWHTAAGDWPLTLLSCLNIASVAISYFLYIYSIRWIGEKVRARDIVAFVFFFPFWLVNMLAQLVATPEWFRRGGRNWWTK